MMIQLNFNKLNEVLIWKEHITKKEDIIILRIDNIQIGVWNRIAKGSGMFKGIC